MSIISHKFIVIWLTTRQMLAALWGKPEAYRHTKLSIVLVYCITAMKSESFKAIIMINDSHVYTYLIYPGVYLAISMASM